jgi:hypothetical protein
MSATTEPHGDYAYGGNYIQHCECPAVAAGFDPEYSAGMLKAAEAYDDAAADLTGNWEGVVDTVTAKEAWMAMLEDARRQNLEYANAAHRVAESLGWLNEEEK